MKLTKPTKSSDIRRSWHLVDTRGKILGRIATDIAKLLIGKSKPYYVAYLDGGDYVVVTNASYVTVTGKKSEQKIYTKYSGFPGGLKKKTFVQVLSENPTRILTEAVAGMLPKNRLRQLMLKRLFVFKDENHPYQNKLKAQISNVKSQS